MTKLDLDKAFERTAPSYPIPADVQFGHDDWIKAEVIITESTLEILSGEEEIEHKFELAE